MEKFSFSLSKIPSLKIRDHYQFLKVLGDQLILKEWCAYGLPSDEVSQSSGLIAMMSKRYPLMIDPQLQAKKWLSNVLPLKGECVMWKAGGDIKRAIEMMKMAIQNG